MITTILTSAHVLVTLFLFGAAALTFLADPRSIKHRAIGFLLVLYGFASIAFGLELNSISVNSAQPWIVLELVTVYGAAPAAFLVALIILRPQTASRLSVSVPTWFFILLPAILVLLDFSNANQAFFSTNILIDFNELRASYTGGYIQLTQATTGIGIFILLVELIFFYMLAIIFPSLITLIQDRKTDQQNYRNALILFIAFSLGTIVSSVFRESLPPTIAPMLTNIILSSGFFIVAMRLTASTAKTKQSWLNLILQKYPMFPKLMGTMAIIILPTMAFIAFTSYSFYQTSILSLSYSNLEDVGSREAQVLLNNLTNEIHTFAHLEESSRIRTQLTTRAGTYPSDIEQVKQQIVARQIRWQDSDPLLISTTLDPVNNTEMRNFSINNPDFSDVVLVDGYGALVTGNQNPGNYDFANTAWWQHIAVSQSVYVGPITWDAALQQYTTVIAVPVFNLNGEALIGSLKTTYALGNLLSGVDQNTNSQTKFGFVTPTGLIIPTSGNQAEEFSIPTNYLTALAEAHDWQTYNVSGTSYLMNSSAVTSPVSEYETSWVLLAYQPVSQALGALTPIQIAIAISALVILMAAVFIIIWVTQSITQPLSILTEAVNKSAAGDRNTLVELDSADEIGALANNFNDMNQQIGHLVDNMEQTIQYRTNDLERKARQMEAAAAVARQAAEVRDLAQLLDLAVNLIPERFGYYHAGIFMLDEQKRYAILQAANSEGGKRMLARGHRLQVGRVGVVGYCAGTGESRIAQDVGADIVYYDNPDMPNTRSEMALPLTVRDQVIGVLDVQSAESNAFNQEDIDVLQLLADQISLAIDNAQLLENSQHALEELQTLYSQEAANAWRAKLTGQQFSYQYDSTGITRKGVVATTQEENTRNALSKPISFRGQVIGNLDFIRDDQDQPWTDDEVQLIEEILEQTALALENARLVDQIRMRSDQIQLLQEITAMAASILDEKELLSSVAQKLQSNLQILHCGIALHDQEAETLTLVASAATAKNAPAVGASVNLAEDDLSQSVLSDNNLHIYHQYADEPNFQAFVQTFSTQGGNSIIFLPLTIRDEVIGYIFLEEKDANRGIDKEETNLFQQISAQLSTAIESARLFAAEQEGRLAAAALLEITQVASASLDMNQVLNQATNRSAQAIQAHRCSIFLLDEKEKLKPIISIYADGQQIPADEWAVLKERIHTTYQDFPLRTLAANLRSPRIIRDPLTYTNIPLSWVESLNITSLLMVPLISQNKVIGSMVYDQVNPDFHFRQNQVEIAQTIAGQIATTIENSKLFEEALQRAERERQVTEITAKIRSSNDPDVIMETAVAELRAVLSKSAKSAGKKPGVSEFRNTSPQNTNGKDTGSNR